MIRMPGMLPTLVGALGVIARKIPTRPYDTLEIKLAETYTCKARVSLYWEAFGNPTLSIAKFALGTMIGGLLGLSVPLEFYGSPTHRTLLLGNPGGGVRELPDRLFLGTLCADKEGGEALGGLRL